jgi:hypothetical protein
VRRLFLFALTLQSSLFAEPSYITFPSDVDWVSSSSNHFELIYRRGEDPLADRTLLAAEKAYSLLEPIFEEMPEKTWIVLADFQDALNGYAIDFPFPHFVVFAAPPEASSALSALDNWLDSVVLHELTHVVHLYPAHSFWGALKSVFGSWVLPNGLMPSHMHEGLATFMETELTRGGRGKGTAFSMFRRMAVKEGVWGKSFAPIDLMEANPLWPQGQSPYFFGYYLYQELWKRKGARGLRDFVQSTSRRLPYLIGSATENLYGQDYVSLWKTIFEKTEAEAQSQIQEMEGMPLSKLSYLSQTYFQKGDLRFSPDNAQVAFRTRNPDTGQKIEVRHVGNFALTDEIDLEPGNQESLCWSKAHPDGLVFAESHSENGYWISALQTYSLATKAKRPLFSQGEPVQNVHLVACAPSGALYTYQEKSGHGFVREWKWDLEHAAIDRVSEWAIPEGTWVTSISSTELPVFTLRKSVSTVFYEWTAKGPKMLAEIAGHFFGLQEPLPSGEWPVVASISGRDEVWAVHLEKKYARKLVSVLGGVNSFAHHEGEWLVSSYRHGGYDIAKAEKASSKPVSISTEPVPERSLAESAPFRKSEYTAWDTLRPRAWIPSFLVVPDGLQISAWIPGFDISQKHLYNLFGGYDTRGSPFIFADYAYRFGLTQQLGVQANYSPSYLISSRTFLRQWGSSVGYSTSLGGDWPRLSLNLLFRRVEESSLGPDNQSLGFSVDLTKQFGFKTTPRGIAPRWGTSISVHLAEYLRVLGSTDDYYSLTVGVDQYLPSPLHKRHGIKLAARFGFSEGTPLYNSFFQGGGELMFSAGRGFFLNRGFLPGSFLSQRMFTTNFDYVFPLIEVNRGISYAPFFLRRIDGALVADLTTAGSFKYYFASTGAELKSYWKTFFYFPTTVRVGGYHGFGQFGEAFYATMALEASI